MENRLPVKILRIIHNAHMLMQRLSRLLKLRPKSQQELTPYESASRLIDAIDAGGLPLNAARVNHTARELGLDVAATAPIEVTIARIRRALKR